MGPGVVEPDVVAASHCVEVVAHEFEVDLIDRRLGRIRLALTFARAKRGDHGAAPDLEVRCGGDLDDHPGGGCHHVVVHLHRLDDGEHRARTDPVPGGDGELDDPALEGRGDGQ